jgi:hypothetical protein
MTAPVGGFRDRETVGDLLPIAAVSSPNLAAAEADIRLPRFRWRDSAHPRAVLLG